MKYNHHLKLSKISNKIKNRLKIIDNLLNDYLNEDYKKDLEEEREYLKIKEIKIFKLTLKLWEKNHAER